VAKSKRRARYPLPYRSKGLRLRGVLTERTGLEGEASSREEIRGRKKKCAREKRGERNLLFRRDRKWG